QDRLAELEASGVAEGAVVIATAQEAGRGRRGRAWHSPPGAGLYLSALLRPGGAAPDAVHWSLAASVAACDALREVGAGAAIKWPNDLLIAGRKAGGLLVETVSVGSRLRAVLIGCGINVAQAGEDFPEELRPIAISLAMATGTAPQRGEVAVALLARLADE